MKSYSASNFVAGKCSSSGLVAALILVILADASSTNQGWMPCYVLNISIK